MIGALLVVRFTMSTFFKKIPNSSPTSATKSARKNKTEIEGL